MPTSPATPLPFWTQYITVIAPIITWIVVIAGWRFVSNDNNAREKRREIRNAIDSIIEIINSLESKSINYYTMGVCDAARLLEMEMKRDLKVLEARLKRLNLSDNHFQTVGMQSNLQKTLTGNDFETITRQKRPHTDRKFLEISSDCTELIEILEIAYISKYKKKNDKSDSKDRNSLILI